MKCSYTKGIRLWSHYIELSSRWIFPRQRPRANRAKPDNEDGGAITAKVKECIEKDPGAFEEDSLVIKIDESKYSKKSSESVEISSNKNEKIEVEA